MMIIGQAVWLYHRFNNSYRDVSEQLLYRGIEVSHETIRNWCYKFSKEFENVIQKKQRKVRDKLKSYVKPIKQMCLKTDLKRHKGLNNRVENAHQGTRRKEKCLIKCKRCGSMSHIRNGIVQGVERIDANHTGITINSGTI